MTEPTTVESTDWAEPVALPRSGLGGAFIELSDAKIVDSADWATLLDKDAPTALSDDEIMPFISFLPQWETIETPSHPFTIT